MVGASEKKFDGYITTECCAVNEAVAAVGYDVELGGENCLGQFLSVWEGIHAVVAAVQYEGGTVDLAGVGVEVTLHVGLHTA
jgi:hypothetical protein